MAFVWTDKYLYREYKTKGSTKLSKEWVIKQDLQVGFFIIKFPKNYKNCKVRFKVEKVNT